MSRKKLAVILLVATTFCLTWTGGADAHRPPTTEEEEAIIAATPEGNIGFALSEILVTSDGRWALATINPDLPSGQSQPSVGIYRAVNTLNWRNVLVTSGVCYGRVLASKGMPRQVSEELAITPCSNPTRRSKNPKIFVSRSPCNTESIAYKPRSIGLSCDSTARLYGIHWTTWGGGIAVGHGRARLQGCEPACADGPVTRPRVDLRLTHIVDFEGQEVYALLHFDYLGPLPEPDSRHKGTIGLLPES